MIKKLPELPTEKDLLAGVGFNKMPMYFKRNGKPYTGEDALFQWAKDMESWDKKSVKQDYLWWGARVSTVWLGLDHSYTDEPHDPIIFESMVFTPFQRPSDWGDDKIMWFHEELDQWRYATEEEALKGHAELKAQWSRIDKAAYHFFASLWNSFYQSLLTLTPIYVRNVLTAFLPPKLSSKILNWLQCTPKLSLSEQLRRSQSSPAFGDTETEKKTSTTSSLE